MPSGKHATDDIPLRKNWHRAADIVCAALVRDRNGALILRFRKNGAPLHNSLEIGGNLAIEIFALGGTADGNDGISVANEMIKSTRSTYLSFRIMAIS